MAYAEAKRATNMALSFPDTSRRRVEHWNAIDDALNKMPMQDFERIYSLARAGNTEADFALVCMCE